MRRQAGPQPGTLEVGGGNEPHLLSARPRPAHPGVCGARPCPVISAKSWRHGKRRDLCRFSTAARCSLRSTPKVVTVRWLRRAPEDFLSGPVVDVGSVRLPRAGTDSRLRWNLNQLHAALNERRRERDVTWADLAQGLNCTPSRLTNLRTARFADMDLAMRVTQWLGQPAAAFIHPAQW